MYIYRHYVYTDNRKSVSASELLRPGLCGMSKSKAANAATNICPVASNFAVESMYVS